MTTFNELLEKIKECSICENHLPLGPKPTIRVSEKSSIIIIGQAPGKKVHMTGIPWNDPSGDRLRDWFNVGREQFYNEELFALVPMGFCYPGTGKTGDLPPRKECAPKWHDPIFSKLKNKEIIFLVGKYAQDYYLKDKLSLTQRVKNFESYGHFIPLPHPSPRNLIWLKKNPWFEKEVLPKVKEIVKEALDNRNL